MLLKYLFLTVFLAMSVRIARACRGDEILTDGRAQYGRLASIPIGDLSDKKPASEASTSLINAIKGPIKEQFSKKAGMKPQQFKLVSYRYQVKYNGILYFAKVKCDNEGSYAHLRIFNPYLPFRPTRLEGVQYDHGSSSKIVYFEADSGTEEADGEGYFARSY